MIHAALRSHCFSRYGFEIRPYLERRVSKEDVSLAGARFCSDRPGKLVVMPPTEDDVSALNRISQVLSEREDHYDGGIQTTVLSKEPTGWKNLLSTLHFPRKGQAQPSPAHFEYGDSAIIRRQVPTGDVGTILKKLLHEGVLDAGKTDRQVESPVTFVKGAKDATPRSEWSKWPADVFTLEPIGQPFGSSPSHKSFVALDAPYYPSLKYVLLTLFGFTGPNWLGYFRGQVVIVLPDFRARISKLTVGLGFMKVDMEFSFLNPPECVAKVYAENFSGPLAQETIQVRDQTLQIDLNDKPTFASVVLILKATGEALDEKTFEEGARWQEPEVHVETSEQEIEQMLLVGEGDTIEFREKLNSEKPVRLAKTAVAFANTRGGVIVFGIDDDNHVVGCEIKGLADAVTNILRAHCDPSPMLTPEVVVYKEKKLLFIRVSESQGPAYTVKELGPFIRANATNRAPTSREVEFLNRRRNSRFG